MVHRANPYSDIPSLYDMYVQASTRQKPTERFGMEVFRNTSNDPEAIPMDLPVGPDYVLGPGDSLEIDLWGGVSQRMYRVVDREGRVSLPEAGPLLVSGRNLGRGAASGTAGATNRVSGCLGGCFPFEIKDGSCVCGRRC